MFNKREILNELIQVFKKNLSNLDSVLLAGSFSRNEESFLQISSNLIVPLSDIEFIIFQKRQKNKRKTLNLKVSRFKVNSLYYME